MSDSAEVTYTVVELPLKSKRHRSSSQKKHAPQPRTLRFHALHVSSSLVPSELLSSTSTTPSTPSTPPTAPSPATPPSTPEEAEEEEEELGQKRTRSETQRVLPAALPASSWLLAQELAEYALALAPSYVRKRLTSEPLASLPQWSSRTPEVLRVVARLNRQDPLRPRGMPKVTKLLPLSTARALLEEVGGDHKPTAQHLLYYLRGEHYEEDESSEDDDDSDGNEVCY